MCGWAAQRCRDQVATACALCAGRPRACVFCIQKARAVKNIKLRPSPLTQVHFKRFGQVMDTTDAETLLINNGTTERFHDLASVDVIGGHGRVSLSIFRVLEAASLPMQITLMERDPLGSQSFMPLGGDDWFIVVCEGQDKPDPATLRCFRATGQQGINYGRNVWHHPLISQMPGQQFLVVDRVGDGDNLEVACFDQGEVDCLLQL
jgi:ureidoglycolate lyase